MESGFNEIKPGKSNGWIDLEKDQLFNSGTYNMVNLEEVEGIGDAAKNLHSTTNPLVLVVKEERDFSKAYLASKRAFDLISAVLSLVLLFPFFLLIAILIVGKDGLPVLFRHRRVGKDGKEFFVLKFRTMRRDAESYLARNPELLAKFMKSFKLDDDPRITPLGKWLRALSLDELPQLLNVLRGEMSMVGPRPVVEKELEKYGKAKSIYFRLKPGCAGLWQCSGRSDTSYEERIELDIEYARKASFLFDAKIFFCTILAIFRRQGAR